MEIVFGTLGDLALTTHRFFSDCFLSPHFCIFPKPIEKQKTENINPVFPEKWFFLTEFLEDNF